LDWNETATLGGGVTVHCLPARHFSGRGLRSNRTLWASFLVEASGRKVYIGGDGGYGAHYADIGKRFPRIDLAVLENGQYNVDWR
ncbi:MBL fold metallo-hydrolase, partial [Escherichia coli]|nr:MBL fold metallo-hydrolase [Escherichia coli]